VKWRRISNKELRENYRAVFGPASGPAAQHVWLDLWDKCGMTRTNFVPGQPDTSAFNDGCRSIFLHILQMTYEPNEQPQAVNEVAGTEFLNE
jgi:hypothetical protein